MKGIFYLGLVWSLSLLSSFSPQSENYFVIEGMQVEWEFEDKALTFKLHSPYRGWLALGFNDQNQLIDAHLIKGAVAATEVIVDEFYVVGFGDSRPITELGATKKVIYSTGAEDETGTTLMFRLSPESMDEYDYNLQPGSEVWLICAYSLEDDFGHHSVMRRHVKVTL